PQGDGGLLGRQVVLHKLTVTGRLTDCPDRTATPSRPGWSLTVRRALHHREFVIGTQPILHPFENRMDHVEWTRIAFSVVIEKLLVMQGSGAGGHRPHQADRVAATDLVAGLDGDLLHVERKGVPPLAVVDLDPA